MKTNVLMPMAGGGLRFREMGYEVSKPAILTYDIHTGEELPMVVCATKDVPCVIPDGNNLCFVERDFHHTDGTEDAIKKYYPKAKFITVDHTTEGGACTCLLAEDWIERENELIIAGCDNGMELNVDVFNEQRKQADVLVFTFRHNRCVMDNPSAYGWMRVDENKNITGVSIKKAISTTPMEDHAVVATVWFKKGSIFIDAAKKMIAENDRVNGEFYVDEVVKHAMDLGCKAQVFEIDRYIGWGTPADFENYRKTFTYWSGFYKKEKNRFFQSKRGEVFTIGIAGDSGSGKSEMIEKIRHLFGPSSGEVLFMEGDGDHRWARNDSHWETITALNPDANDLYRQADSVRKLRKGNPVERRDYHHDSGMFGNLQRIIPHKFIVLCGLHALYLPELRKELDLKIFMDTEENLRRLWKLRRDIRERGHSKEEAEKQIEKRMEDAESYISPQKQYADLVVSYYDDSLQGYTDPSYEEKISVRFRISDDIDGKLICDELKGDGFNPRITIDANNYQTISISSEDLVANHQYGALAERCIHGYKESFPYDIRWDNGVEGVVQFFVLLMIVKKLGDLM